jgi:hypothetical protein
MHHFLFDFTLLTVGTHRLVVGAILLSVTLDVDGSYVDGKTPM